MTVRRGLHHAVSLAASPLLLVRGGAVSLHVTMRGTGGAVNAFIALLAHELAHDAHDVVEDDSWTNSRRRIAHGNRRILQYLWRRQPASHRDRILVLGGLDTSWARNQLRTSRRCVVVSW